MGIRAQRGVGQDWVVEDLAMACRLGHGPRGSGNPKVDRRVEMAVTCVEVERNHVV
jgi:hypothetical protein